MKMPGIHNFANKIAMTEKHIIAIWRSVVLGAAMWFIYHFTHSLAGLITVGCVGNLLFQSLDKK